MWTNTFFEGQDVGPYLNLPHPGNKGGPQWPSLNVSLPCSYLLFGVPPALNSTTRSVCYSLHFVLWILMITGLSFRMASTRFSQRKRRRRSETVLLRPSALALTSPSPSHRTPVLSWLACAFLWLPAATCPWLPHVPLLALPPFYILSPYFQQHFLC